MSFNHQCEVSNKQDLSLHQMLGLLDECECGDVFGTQLQAPGMKEF